MYFVIVLGSLFLFASSVRADVVSIQQGLLSGIVMRARNGTLFKGYYGIPFAQPPVGRLRLQPPLEPKPWVGMLNASVSPPPCVQIQEKTKDTIIGSEDCLYLNVFTPLNAKKGDNYPVIVYVYGGVFKNGGNTFHKPYYMMQKDVIIVQMNYRAGPLGFLSTGDTVITGNFALKDQNMSLKWTKRNIRAFGGDPNRVTLHGHSSGAMCVHFHTLSPLSEGLFDKIILQSGSGFSQMAHFGLDVAKSLANEFAERVGCSTGSSQAMLSCFLELKPSVFPLVAEEMHIWDEEPNAIFRPTVENKTVENAFFVEFPNNVTYKSTSQPWLVGITTGEGAYKVKRFLYRFNELGEEINAHSKLLFPITLQYLWNTKRKHLNYMSRLIRTRYFKNKEISQRTTDQLVDMYTEGLYGWSAIDSIRRYSGEKYVYLYDHISNYSMTDAINGKYLGVNHADELYLLFYTTASGKYLNATDIMLGDEMITRWVNFVYSGNTNTPLPINETILSSWAPMTSDRIEYLRIKVNGSMETDLYKGKYDFWKRLPIGSKYF